MIQQRPSTTERKQTRSARIEKEEFTQTMKIHSLSTNSPPPVLMESQVKVHSLTAKCHSNPNWSEKMLFTHTHTHLFWSQSLHCSREAKTVSMNSEWRGCMSWNDRNEERTRHLTGFSLSDESSRKRNTLDPSFYISAPLKTSRKWLNFSFVWGGANLPFSCEKSKGQVKKHPLNIL